MHRISKALSQSQHTILSYENLAPLAVVLSKLKVRKGSHDMVNITNSLKF